MILEYYVILLIANSLVSKTEAKFLTYLVGRFLFRVWSDKKGSTIFDVFLD